MSPEMSPKMSEDAFSMATRGVRAAMNNEMTDN
jgi:hypothetical protein